MVHNRVLIKNKCCSTKKIIAEIFEATIIIIVFHALLPNSFRFSRVLVPLGALWSFVFVSLSQILLHLAGFNSFKFATSKKNRIALVGELAEAAKVHEIVKKSVLGKGLIYR